MLNAAWKGVGMVKHGLLCCAVWAQGVALLSQLRTFLSCINTFRGPSADCCCGILHFSSILMPLAFWLFRCLFSCLFQWLWFSGGWRADPGEDPAVLVVFPTGPVRALRYPQFMTECQQVSHSTEGCLKVSLPFPNSAQTFPWPFRHIHTRSSSSSCKTRSVVQKKHCERCRGMAAITMGDSTSAASPCGSI